MQSASQKEYIVIEGKHKQHKLGINEYTRWLCLIEGIMHVQKKAEQIKVSLQNLDWIKPLSFQKFIEERFASLLETVEQKELLTTHTKRTNTCVTLLEPAFV